MRGNEAAFPPSSGRSIPPPEVIEYPTRVTEEEGIPDALGPTSASLKLGTGFRSRRPETFTPGG
jgi:hypothetical protein